MVFVSIVVVLAFSLDWAAWGDYKKCKDSDVVDISSDISSGEEGYDGCKKGYGCHKGYTRNGSETCVKCASSDAEKANCVTWNALPANVGSPQDIDGVAYDYFYKEGTQAGSQCQCDGETPKATSCPAQAKAQRYAYKKASKEAKKKLVEREKKDYKERNKTYLKYDKAQMHFEGCMMAGWKGTSYWSVWAFILVLAVGVVVVIAIIIIIIVVVLKLTGKKAPEKIAPTSSAEDKQVTPTTTRSDVVASAEASPQVIPNGPYVVVKMGTTSNRTKSVQNGPALVWGENVVLANLGGEDEDAEFELIDQATQAQLGKAVIRIVDYVNKKTHVSVTLKDGSDATVGILETDIEIKVDEAKNPPEVGAEIFVDKYNKAQ